MQIKNNSPFILTAMISLGLIINSGVLLATCRRLMLGGPVIALGLTGKSLCHAKLELILPTRSVQKQGCLSEFPAPS